ncbi:hypothetical protein RHMOL_Rhmol01G0225200 [Rhododendron molle]|uniref:Uncharacterized protein n=1 Tax=Rhododendron molle TaxID=49168 RepID=A0ACC0Q4S8_RHOML|nr:hypothetical protein RHMOL_Rhmol01G0225200 [Rhododendron molle]
MLQKMAKDGKKVLKPGELAQETRNYLEKRSKLMKENYEKIEALGCKQLANPFLKKSTSTGKRRHKMDCAVNDDEDWQPGDCEDGSSSCFEDDECSLEDDECSGARLSKVATTRKRVQLPAGPMSATLQPLPTISQDQHENQPVQLQAQLQVQAKSQDQHENQPVQLQAQPQVQAKRVRCRAAPMSIILQSLPTISQDQHGNQPPPDYHEFQSPSDEVAGHINERVVELESHQHSMSSHTTPNLHSLEQSNEGSRTSVGADPNSQQQRARGRGFARPYVGWGTGAKLEVKLNKDDQPIGNTAGPLQSQLGILARNATLAPLTFTDWRAPELYPYKERIWAEVKRRLNEGASQIPESSESPTLREELFTSVLKPDRNGRVRTYGLGPCPSQVFGTRYTRSQEQRVKDQLRAELRAELGAELRAVLGAELRQEVLRDVSDEITQLKNQYATVAAYMKSAGHPLPPPNGAGNGDGDHTPSQMEHNGQLVYGIEGFRTKAFPCGGRLEYTRLKGGRRTWKTCNRNDGNSS